MFLTRWHGVPRRQWSKGFHMTHTELVNEIQRLADIEAIKQLKYRYAEICDDNHNPDRICSVFTEDAIWDAGEKLGKYVGHAQIRDAFSNFAKALDFSRHYLTNPIITMDGNQASGEWYASGLFRVRNGPDYFAATTFIDEYEKTNGKWLIKKLVAKLHLAAPRAVGWKDQLLHNLAG